MGGTPDPLPPGARGHRASASACARPSFSGGAAVSAPRAPKGLGPAGRRVWRGTLGERDDGSQIELRADELPLLVELCRLADDVEKIRGVLADEPWTVPGSKGQPVPHPLRGELHRTLSSMDRLVRTLALPDDPAEDAGGATVAGRNLARQRWSA